MAVPTKYQYLVNEPTTVELKEAIKHYGTLEHVGKGSNVNILSWATEVGVKGWYADDDVPWCGLFKGVCAKRSGWLNKPKYDLLSALSWLVWGDKVIKGGEMLGDTLVFSRNGGGHVAYYVGEDKTHLHCLGGNQSNAVTITRIAKDRLVGCRRAQWKIAQPASVRKIYLTADGSPVSTNEA